MAAPPRVLGHVAFWPVAALGVLLTGWLVLAAAGVAPISPAERPRAADAAPAPVPTVPVRTAAATVATTQRKAPPPVARRVTVTVSATRGESWIAARVGSESGRLLEERLLPQGETAQLTGPRVWLLVGAAANVDVLVDGEPRELAPGTVETVFSPAR